eukprot:scaffold92009_cov60-Cyclotella_meneghiniana.AAC.3
MKMWRILRAETAKGDAVNLIMTYGGDWLSVGLDSEAVVVSPTADRRRVGQVTGAYTYNYSG